FSLLIPIAAIIGFSVLIYHLVKLRHFRIMEMIAKGTYNPKPWNWRLILLLLAVLLTVTGPGVTLLSIEEVGLLKAIGVGLLMFLGGIGLLVSRKFWMKYLPPVQENQNR
ncbi:MAG: hypothetical protein GY940_15315, partial [bacterium]|nr:hypothetical protein [bacterium]